MADDPTMAPRRWSVIARNLPEHASNRIHTDDGAREAGYPAALVAGVTTYAYLTHPIVEAWGVDWLRRGCAEVRFVAPVFAGDLVACVPVIDDGGVMVVDAVCAARDTAPRATVRAVREGASPPAEPAGERLADRRVDIGAHYGIDYGARVGDDIAIYPVEGLVHPAVWPAIGNLVMSEDLVHGSWIHTRSVVRHHATCPAGAVVDVAAVVADRSERRSGSWAVIDVVVELDGRPIVTMEHEAIVRLSGA